MSQGQFSLDVIEVASPCGVPWEQMQGDEKVRFCGQCRLNVYNLSGMTRGEAEDVIRQHHGHLCVRFYRRIDGTVLTRDCPVGWRGVRRRLVRKLAAAASLVGALLFGSAQAAEAGEPSKRPPGWSGWIRCIRWLEGEPVPASPSPNDPPKSAPPVPPDLIKIIPPIRDLCPPLQGRLAYPPNPPFPGGLLLPPPPAPAGKTPGS